MTKPNRDSEGQAHVSQWMRLGLTERHKPVAVGRVQSNSIPQKDQILPKFSLVPTGLRAKGRTLWRAAKF